MTISHAAADPDDSVSFPRLNARTGRFTLGEPRNVTVTGDGAAVLFVRTASGTDRTGALWVYDVASGEERLLADPAVLLGSDGERLSAEERARRERSRESGAGIVGYSVDAAGRTAVFALSGVVWACELATGACRELPCAGPVIDPRIDPTGRRVAYAADRALRVTAVDGSGDRLLIGPDRADPAQDEAVWGQAEFAAAEEMDRYRGFWWAPDGESLLVERYDNAPVGVWYLSDPAHPDREPVAHRYPAAGTANAEVSLWHVTLGPDPDVNDQVGITAVPGAGSVPAAESSEGAAREHAAGAEIADGSFARRIPCTGPDFPYLGRVSWTKAGAVIQVLSRDQRRSQILKPGLEHGGHPLADRYAADPTLNPTCELLAELTDDAWIDLVTGLPALAPDGRLLAADAGYTRRTGAELADGLDAPAPDTTDTHRLTLDGAAITPPGVQLRAVLSVRDDGVIATVSTDATEQQLVHVGYDGSFRVLSTGRGVHSGAADGDTLVIASTSLESVGTQLTVCTSLRALTTAPTVATTSDNELPPGETPNHEPTLTPVGTLANLAATPPFTPAVTLLTVGDRDLNAALVLPQGHEPGSRKLPVILAPYGGPHAQLVRAAGRMFLQAQYLADQGFAVIVADGRGSPGRGPAWERALRHQFSPVTLQDQVDALAAVAARYPDDLDTGRVGILGWSYGGYLSALAVIDRPDIFHAAVAGAPVTDWTLYDTCYTERYLGDPRENPEIYDANSLIGRAKNLTRPLMIVHGLADDNVVVAHALRLSSALLAAGRDHTVLPLTGITHMTSDEIVAEYLLTAQVRFLQAALR